MPSLTKVAAKKRAPIDLKGDGKYFLILGSFFFPACIALLMDKDAFHWFNPLNMFWFDYTTSEAHQQCYHIFWFDALVITGVGILLFVHLLLWYFPRPVSQVDQSPLTTLALGVGLGGPVLAFAYSLYILMVSDSINLCPYNAHTQIFALFYTILTLQVLAGIYLGFQFSTLLYELIFHDPRKSLVPLSVTEKSEGSKSTTKAGTFDSSNTANLDNGRWLTMEARRIHHEEATKKAASK